MRHWPYQMKQSLAAEFCHVSVNYFKSNYRPKLNELEEGGSIFFLKNDLEKFIESRFKKKNTPAIANQAIKKAKPTPVRSDDPFLSAVKSLQAQS